MQFDGIVKRRKDASSQQNLSVLRFCLKAAGSRPQAGCRDVAGFDIGELVTTPSLPKSQDWEAYEALRQKPMPNPSQSQPALCHLQASAA